MNLTTLSRLPAEPLHMLGKSRRQIEEEAAAEAKRNAPPPGPPPMTSAPAGYEVTAQGGLRRKDQPWIVPETKGRAVKAEQINAQPADSGEVPSEEDVRKLLIKSGLLVSSEAWKIIEKAAGFAGALVGDIPADRRAEVIAALNAL